MGTQAQRGGKKAESAKEYFDRIQRENEEAVRIKRAARERIARRMQREKAAEWSRIEREVQASPGAADTRIDSLRLIPAGRLHAENDQRVEKAFDGSTIGGGSAVRMQASRETQLAARRHFPELTK